LTQNQLNPNTATKWPTKARRARATEEQTMQTPAIPIQTSVPSDPTPSVKTNVKNLPTTKMKMMKIYSIIITMMYYNYLIMIIIILWMMMI
jgi:hypothetical protein